MRGNRRSLALAAWTRLTTAAGLVFSLGGCTLTQPLEGLTGGQTPNLDGGARAGGGCPPQMVMVLSNAGPARFCIDRREVSNAEYAPFVASCEGGCRAPQPGPCDGNIAFRPGVPVSAQSGCNEAQQTMTMYPDLPITCVDWCDAEAYCRWRGKRLCGAPGGGTAEVGNFFTATKSEWQDACSSGGARTFPYGNVWNRDACRGADASGAQPVPLAVGSQLGCEGGYPGLFDMSGNIAEWENSCDDKVAVDVKPFCWARGGAFDGLEMDLRCIGVRGIPRLERRPQVGFRCCADWK